MLGGEQNQSFIQLRHTSADGCTSSNLFGHCHQFEVDAFQLQRSHIKASLQQAAEKHTHDCGSKFLL